MSKSLESRLKAIEIRNKKVEDDKAWETSWVRRIVIMALTYLVVAAYLSVVAKIDPWLNALVPVVGFFLSTLTVAVVKDLWLANRKK